MKPDTSQSRHDQSIASDLSHISLPAIQHRSLHFVQSWGLFVGRGLRENGSDVRLAASSDRMIQAFLPRTISGFASTCTIPLHPQILTAPEDQLQPLKEAFHHIVLPLLIRPLETQAFQDLRRELLVASSVPNSAVRVLAESPMNHAIHFRVRIGERCTYLLDTVIGLPSIGDIDVQAVADRGELRFNAVPLNRKYPSTEIVEPLIHRLRHPSSGRSLLKPCLPLIEERFAHP